MNTYEEMGINVTLGIDQVATKTAIDLETLIAQMRASGLSEGAILNSVLSDLNNNGRIFAQFKNGVKNVTQDGVRQAGRVASTKIYQEAGISEYVWITAGGKVCRDCSPRHGEKGTDEYFRMIGKPGTGWSVCQAHCQCILEPANYKGRPKAPIVRAKPKPPVPKPKAVNPLAFNQAGKHKTVKDSIAWMKEHIAHKVTLGKLTDVAIANQVTEAYYQVFSKYKLRKLEHIKMARKDASFWASANGRGMKIRGDQFDPKVLANQYIEYGQGLRVKILKELGLIESRLKGATPDTYTYRYLERVKFAKMKRLKMIDDNGFTRWGVSFKGKELASTIHHEMGHVIHDQYTGGFNMHLKRTLQSRQLAGGWNTEWIKLFNDLKNKRKLGWSSEYASSDHYELFAESFSMYMRTSEKRKMPSSVVNFFDRYLTENMELMGGT